MKTGFLITARLKSTRLPMKLLQEVEGRPIFAHMLDRLKLTRHVNEIVVCTSTNPQDDPLQTLAEHEGVSCFRGHEDDVVRRLYDAATAFELDYFLSITADCPFCDPEYADRIVEAYERTKADLIRALQLPHGAFSYGVKPEAFRQILEIKDQTDSEVWSRYFTDTDLFDVYDLPIENEFHQQPHLRMTLDYPEDLEFFKAVFSHLYEPGRVFTLDEILRFLRAHPEVVEINKNCTVPFQKRWLSQSDIKLKPRYAVNRALVVGCGSIGQRHIRNLKSLGIDDVFAIRTKLGTSQELDPQLQVNELSDWNEVAKCKPDIAIVSNPTSLHLDTINRCLQHVKGVFIEKPVSHSLDGIQELLPQIKLNKVVSFVGFVLQFHPLVKALRAFLNSERGGPPLVLQCQVGQYIEDWHPEEDYRTAYFARRDLGGGALLSLIHEIHLATDLLGPAARVSCMLPSCNLFNVDVDAIADLMVHHISGAISQIHLDMVQRPTHREGIVSCQRGSVRYDLIANEIEAQTVDDEKSSVIWQDSNYEFNDAYLEEMRTFLDYVREGRVRHAYDAWKAVQSLSIVASAKIAADSNSVVPIPDWVRDLNSI